MSSDLLYRTTQRSLEWVELLEQLSKLAHTSLGADLCRTLPFGDNISSAEDSQSETTEMVFILASSFPLPEFSFNDLNPIFIRASKGARLEAQELRDISNVLDLFRRVRECIAFHSPPLQVLNQKIDPVTECSFVQRAIDRTISPDGEVLEGASPSLKAAIQESNSLKQTIRHRLDRMISSEHYARILQDPYYAQRQSRYVLPIKADRQHLVSGIVHDESASGATVFFEPRELIDMNNQIKAADLQVTREINHILLQLSELVAKQVVQLQDHLNVLAVLDCIAAKARLSIRMKAQPVDIHPQGEIHLYQARHPLLSLNRETIVPNDIFFGKEDRVLVISGPNTGGKTVTLKLLGLYALMLKVGLHLPCGEGSIMGFFHEVFADIGDAQDLRNDLSSFSAHINNMVILMNSVRVSSADASTRYLVLLDEIMSSTDPAEGTALAEALLLELANMGLKVAVTTHYNELKVLALSTPGFLNASLEIHVPSLIPTYRLIQGFPGGSSAFDIAAHLGMDQGLLVHARTLVKKEERNLENLFAELQDTQGQLNEELKIARKERQSADKAAQDAKILLETLQQAENEKARAYRRQFRESFTSAKQEIRQILEALRRDKSHVKAKEALQSLTDLSNQVKHTYAPSLPEIPLETLGVGDYVEIAGLETMGILLELPKGRRRVRIKVGDTEISAPTDVLKGRRSENSPKKSKRTQGSPPKELANREGARQETSEAAFFTAMTIDIRGQTADEALEQTVAMLDQAALKHLKGIRIIHGHGTGKLKQVIRRYVSQSPYVLSFRPGSEGEGGEGVTMIEMR